MNHVEPVAERPGSFNPIEPKEETILFQKPIEVLGSVIAKVMIAALVGVAVLFFTGLISLKAVSFTLGSFYLVGTVGQTVVATLMTVTGYNRPVYGGAPIRWVIVGMGVLATAGLFTAPSW